MVVDFHSHDFPAAVAPRAMAGLCRATEGLLWPAGDGTVESHLDALDCAGVDRAVVCQIATKPRQWEFILRRARAMMSGELGARARRKLIPFCSVHPQDPDFAAHLGEIAAAGVKGVKFHPHYQGFSLADPAVWPVFRRVAELGLVVECHAGLDLGFRDRTDRCGPKEIEALLKNVRGLVFVAAHLGGCAGFRPHETDRLLDAGCRIDTSALHRDWSLDEQMRLLHSWPADRILFGTDYPWVHYPEAIAWVKSVRAKRDWDAVFGGNACRLLSI